MSKKASTFGNDLIEALQEVAAHSRGDIGLPFRDYPSMTAERVKAVRKAAARSPKDFAAQFRIPARTIEGWEQGRRRPDPASSLLLRLIEADPDFVRKVAAAS